MSENANDNARINESETEKVVELTLANWMMNI